MALQGRKDHGPGLKAEPGSAPLALPAPGRWGGQWLPAIVWASACSSGLALLPAAALPWSRGPLPAPGSAGRDGAPRGDTVLWPQPCSRTNQPQVPPCPHQCWGLCMSPPRPCRAEGWGGDSAAGCDAQVPSAAVSSPRQGSRAPGFSDRTGPGSCKTCLTCPWM